MSVFRTALLPLIVVVPVLMAVACALYVRRRRRTAAALGDRWLVLRLTGVDLHAFPRRRVSLMLLAAVALGIAGADPRWGVAADAQVSAARDIVLVLDASNSMRVEDVPPNRLEHQRLAARTIVDALGGERVGVVVFAGDAAVLSPPTTDHSAVAGYIDAVHPEIVVQTGTAIGTGIRAGTALLAASSARPGGRVLILISDGEPLEPEVERPASLEAAQRAGAMGIVIHTLGVGTERGGFVPQFDPNTRQRQGYKVDPFTGETAVSRLDEDLLRQIAREARGSYRRASTRDGVETLLTQLGTGSGAGHRESQQAPRYAWLVGFALLLIAVDGAAERIAARSARSRPAS
jgi:Ca-activated chloride channel homolog